jgi:ABC-type antimicrobial peptide transport system permease subunit
MDLPGGGPYYAQAGNDYFAALGTKIIRGRAFTPEEERGPSHVLIVNKMMADAYWPGQDPIGQCVKLDPDPVCSTVVGVVENVLFFKMVNDDRASYYIPWGHASYSKTLASAMIVRVRGDVDQLLQPLHQALQSIAPASSYVTLEPYTQIVSPEMRSWRLGATMFSVFGILATIIAAVGLYSVMAYWASQRTHEIGVRMALGAQRADVVRLLAVNAARTVGIGLTVGTIVALGLSRWAADLLFDTSPRQLSAYVIAASALGVAAVVATVVPARRVAAVDPAVALRNE